MPLISQSTLDNIEQQPLSEGIGCYLSLSKKGANFVAKSPFSEDKTASFTVNDSKNVWKCFSTGKAGRSLIDFLKHHKNLDFVEATKTAAEKLNILVEYDQDTQENKEKRAKIKQQKDLMQYTHDHFSRNFKHLAKEHWAKDYMLNQRAFDQETLDLFDIGYAFGQNSLSPIFREMGQSLEAEDLSLVSRDQNGGNYDFFRDRIIFPINNSKGICVGFGGRKNPKTESGPKYVNSRESDFYKKSELLFGLNLAKKSIEETKQVYLVEGYTDVMRMHQIGISNCVATCGTALTESHVKQLKSIANTVVLFRDADEAGQKAARRDFELLAAADLFVEIVVIENPTDDPDTIGQNIPNAKEYIEAITHDYIIHSVSALYKKSFEADKNLHDKKQEKLGVGAKKTKATLSPLNTSLLAQASNELLGYINNPITRERYFTQISDVFPALKKEIKSLLKQKEAESKTKRKFYESEDDMYQLPEGLDISLDDVIDDIRNYGIFQAEKQIFIKGNDKPPYYFESCSNFDIEIVQHMQDDGYQAMKLVRMNNVVGKSVIFDVLSEKINTIQSFKNVISNHGNFFCWHKAFDHDNILRMLFDKMGDGRKIDILGWQPEGFWAWNNKIIIPGKEAIIISKEGLFEYEKTSYYIPSANKNYETNNAKFMAQKKFRSIETKSSIEDYLNQMYAVHGGHAITGMLFGIASLFQDIIVKDTTFFPILFYTGPASTGKDLLAHAVQSFVGIPQSPINLEGGVSTMKAQVREFAQFNNGISHLSEYRNGDDKLDGVLKAIWDRNGYKKGNIASSVGIDEVPISSSALITSNYYPTAEALITRLLWNEMSINTFSDEQNQRYIKFKELVKKGISGLSDFFINKRELFQEKFAENYSLNTRMLNEMEPFKSSLSRITNNLSVLASVYTIFRDMVHFPFTQAEMHSQFLRMVNNQNMKLKSSSPFLKFWDCFLASMRGTIADQLRVNIDIRLDGNLLMFNFTNVFNKVQTQWYKQFQEASPPKNSMKDILKSTDYNAFIEDKTNVRLNKLNTNIAGTSVMIFDLNKIDLKDEIIYQIQLQLSFSKVQEIDPKEDFIDDKLPIENPTTNDTDISDHI